MLPAASGSYAGIAACAAGASFFGAFIAVLLSVSVAELFGVQAMASGFGLLVTTWLFGAVPEPVAGWIADTTGSYTAAWLMAAGLFSWPGAPSAASAAPRGGQRAPAPGRHGRRARRALPGAAGGGGGGRAGPASRRAAPRGPVGRPAPGPVAGPVPALPVCPEVASHSCVPNCVLSVF